MLIANITAIMCGTEIVTFQTKIFYILIKYGMYMMVLCGVSQFGKGHKAQSIKRRFS